MQSSGRVISFWLDAPLIEALGAEAERREVSRNHLAAELLRDGVGVTGDGIDTARG